MSPSDSCRISCAAAAFSSHLVRVSVAFAAPLVAVVRSSVSSTAWVDNLMKPASPSACFAWDFVATSTLPLKIAFDLWTVSAAMVESICNARKAALRSFVLSVVTASASPRSITLPSSSETPAVASAKLALKPTKAASVIFIFVPTNVAELATPSSA